MSLVKCVKCGYEFYPIDEGPGPQTSDCPNCKATVNVPRSAFTIESQIDSWTDGDSIELLVDEWIEPAANRGAKYVPSASKPSVPPKIERQPQRGVLVNIAWVKATLWVVTVTMGLTVLAALFQSNGNGVRKPKKSRLQLKQDNVPRFNADDATEKVMDNLLSTPGGRAKVEHFGGKDAELTRFQRLHGISDRVAEAAIKEWILTHNGDFDWDLKEVKAICLRRR